MTERTPERTSERYRQISCDGRDELPVDGDLLRHRADQRQQIFCTSMSKWPGVPAMMTGACRLAAVSTTIASFRDCEY